MMFGLVLHACAFLGLGAAAEPEAASCSLETSLPAGSSLLQARFAQKVSQLKDDDGSPHVNSDRLSGMAELAKLVTLHYLQMHGSAHCEQAFMGLQSDVVVSEEVVQGVLFTINGTAESSKGPHSFSADLFMELSPHILELPSEKEQQPSNLMDWFEFRGYHKGEPCGTSSSSAEALAQQAAKRGMQGMHWSRFAKDFLGHVEEDPEFKAAHTRLVQLSEKQQLAIPSEWDWRKHIPVGSAGMQVRNQGSCGSCWTWASASSISDRFYVATNGSMSSFISPQYFTSCASHDRGGCKGGNAAMAFEKMNGGDDDQGAVDDACMPYTGQDHLSGSGCSVPGNCFRYFTSGDVQYVRGEVAAIQHEIMTAGPAYVSFQVFRDFSSYKGGVYRSHGGEMIGSHAVKLIGWGTDDASGSDYWLLQNSWGTGWGENGFFRMRRGVDECQLESRGISFAMPDLGKLCSNTCVHGSFDIKCQCGCKGSWVGSACDVCGRTCGGAGSTGEIAQDSCSCRCKPGYFGADCEVEVQLDSTSMVEGGQVTLTFSSESGSTDFHAKDRLVAFMSSEAPWQAETGWKVSKMRPVELGSVAAAGAGSFKFHLYSEKAGEIQIYVMHSLGLNEFGENKGFSTGLTPVAAVSITCPADGCKPAPPICSDSQELVRPVREHREIPIGQKCSELKQQYGCKEHLKIYGLVQDYPVVMGEICAGTCRFCEAQTAEKDAPNQFSKEAAKRRAEEVAAKASEILKQMEEFTQAYGPGVMDVDDDPFGEDYRVVSQSSTFCDETETGTCQHALLAKDDDDSTCSRTSDGLQAGAFWAVDLKAARTAVKYVMLLSSIDMDVQLRLGSTGTESDPVITMASLKAHQRSNVSMVMDSCPDGATCDARKWASGRHLRISRSSPGPVQLCDVKVLGHSFVEQGCVGLENQWGMTCQDKSDEEYANQCQRANFLRHCAAACCPFLNIDARADLQDLFTTTTSTTTTATTTTTSTTAEASTKASGGGCDGSQVDSDSFCSFFEPIWGFDFSEKMFFDNCATEGSYVKTYCHATCCKTGP